MAHKVDPRRIKIHRPYMVDEVARALDVHRNTVRNWLKRGLEAIEGRPLLIRGKVLRAYLEDKRRKAKRPCLPGQFYCLRCRAPKKPALDMVDYEPSGERAGTLVGICPDCEGMIRQATSLRKLEAAKGGLLVSFQRGQRHITERRQPHLDCDFRGSAETDGKAQPEERATEAQLPDVPEGM